MKLGIIALLLLSALPMVAAQEDRTDYLNAQYSRVACGIDYLTGVFEVTIDKVPQTSNLKPHIKTLTEDKEELHILASEGNAKGFWEYVKETLRPHVKEAREDFKKNREKFDQWNIDNETIAELRAEYKEKRAELKACRDAGIISVGKAKVAWYESHLAKKEAKTQNLSARGVDTSLMMGTIAGAWNVIVNPLKEAVSSEDPQTVKNALHTYHLFNGGNESGISYHFAAKYQNARLGGILGAVAPKAEEAGHGDTVNEIRGLVDSTEAMLVEIADEKYAEGEGEQVWSNIKQGFSMLRELIKALK